MPECSSCNKTDCSAKKPMSDESSEEFAERRAIANRLCRIKHKILIISGKGGVGKSTVAANFAAVLAASGKKAGIMDLDIHGPSIPGMLGVKNKRALPGENGMILPVQATKNLKAISIGFLLQEQDDAVIWRGPMKFALIKQFLKDVEWGELDYLIADLPPGTGDEPLSIAQLIGNDTHAVIVTTPQEVALADVRKSINFCRKLNISILGVIENMSGFTCPKCGETTYIFKKGGAEKMCRQMNVPFTGSIPLNPGITDAGDTGSVSAVTDYFEEIVKKITGDDSLSTSKERTRQ